MQTRTRDIFATVKTEGSLLPADLLQRLVEGDGNLEGLKPEDYHLGEGEKLREVISSSWNRLLGRWNGFSVALSALPQQDLGTTVTREKWLLPLFQELGYGRLLTSKAVEIDGRSYVLSHMWQNTAIHLVGCRVDIEKRTSGVAGAARISPHGMVQEFLNRSSAHLWAFLSNGLRLRILRDNVSLTRQAYAEFDLAGMMEGEVYSDFVLLWLLCHQSRVEADVPEKCWLERWSRTAQEQGTRALDQLRDGVEQAIKALGSGFLAYRGNTELKQKLRTGALNKQDYYRQLLRLVYRMIFLFVAEERGLLLDPKAEPSAKDTYIRYYSATRVRRLAEKKRGTQHCDLWRGLSLMFDKLGSDEGCADLALPPLGSYLWSKDALGDLHGCDIANRDLLEAVRALAFTVDKNAKRVVDYKNLGAEELGSIYESLLELHPELNADAGTFELTTASGHERKTTGSYYTPTSLINCLLDSALEPVLKEALKAKGPEQAILNLKVCDPACGSGHFLVAAAHRMAKRLAAVRTGDDEPSPVATHKALRDVIGHCIYGVDINPMAVELCKVSLWMEALEPGRPLSFLDHHIQCGNSLLGATPASIENGIPDEAFNPIEGDDKKVCQEFKKRNKEERKGKQRLFDAEGFPWEHLGNLAASMVALDGMEDDSIGGVRRKQEKYENLVRSSGYEHGRFLADAWCAAFVWKKSKEFAYPVTQDVLRRIEHNPHDIEPWMKEEIKRLAEQYRLFHWHLAFPDVFRVPGKGEKPENERTGRSGGFDVVLGNPPWEKVQPEEKQFFASVEPDTASASALKRKQSIDNLRITESRMFGKWLEYKRNVEAMGLYARGSSQYRHSAKGNLNLAYLFVEMGQQLLRDSGKLALLVPSGIATNDLSKEFFAYLVGSKSLIQVVDFENRAKLFPAVDERFRFSVVIACQEGMHSGDPEFAFFLQTPDELRDGSRLFTLSPADLRLLNPTSGVSLIFRSRRDAEIAKNIYRQTPVLSTKTHNPWAMQIYTEMFNLTRSMDVLHTADELVAQGFQLRAQNVYQKGDERCLPVFEGKIITLYNHRAASIVINPENLHRPAQTVDAANESLENPNYYPLPQFWTHEDEFRRRRPQGWKFRWFGGYKRVTAQTNFRTLVGCIIPDVPSLYTISLVLPNVANTGLAVCLFANLWSYPFDYLVRQKTSQPSLPQSCVEQTAVIPPERYSCAVVDLIVPRVLELTYTAWDLQPFAQDCGYDGPPFRWDKERRFLARCELDAAFFHLYDIELHDVDYIMETFPIVKRKDEQLHGEYRTKRVILEIYDAMKEAMETGKPYQTRLDPPPADPRVAHPTRV